MQCMNFVLVYLEAVKNIVKLGWTNILKQNETGGEMRIVKLREREGQRVDLGRSLKGHLWMVDGGWWYTFP